MPSIRCTALLTFALLLALPAAAFPQVDWDKFEVESTELAQGVYMLAGAGGRIGVSVGEDGVMLIDDQFGQLTEKIKFALAQITEQPVVFVLNTHGTGITPVATRTSRPTAPGSWRTTTCGSGSAWTR